MIKFKYLFFIVLFFTCLAAAKDYKGAELRTTETFTYGRFEANFKPPAGDGFLASFFTYHEISNLSEWNEIDIEILGRYYDNVQFNTITPGQTNHEIHQHVTFNPHNDFHTYAFEWTPEYVAWFVDGQEMYRQTGEHIATLQLAQKLMMNIWMPQWENWVGLWDDRLLPKFAYYDWVSYASYTPGTGNCGTANNFTFQWKDDFNSWNTNRWQKASHTWDGNRVDFTPDNVVLKNGYMILCLTDNTDSGLVDNIPPYVLWARSAGNLVTLHFSEIVDSVSAEKVSNYYIGGITVNSVILLQDKQSVQLSVSDIDTSASYSVAVLGVIDASPNGNKQMGQVTSIVLDKPLQFPVKINTGGGKIYGAWLADQEWSAQVEYGHMDGGSKKWSSTIDIRETVWDSLYRDELNGSVKYKIRVSAGIYSLVLHFAENEYSETGQRVFKVVVEDSIVTGHIDLFSEAGQHTAFDLEINSIQVLDGIMDIHLIDWTGHTLLNGLTLERESTGLEENRFGEKDTFRLFQNYPNPFNSKTVIGYHVETRHCLVSTESSVHVELAVYNSMGQLVSKLVNTKQQSGNYISVFSNKELASGLYFYRLTAGGSSQFRKMLLLK